MKLGAPACACLVACGGGAPPRLPNIIDKPASPPVCAVTPSPKSWANDARPSAFIGPKTPTAVWIRELQGPVQGLAVDGGANAFVTMKGGIVALRRDGTVRWTHVGTVPARALPAVGADGAVYIDLLSDKFDPFDIELGRGRVQRLDACGQVIWTVHAPPQNPMTPTIGPDATVYFSGHDRLFERPEHLYAVREDGTIVWSRPIDRGDAVTTRVALGGDHTIYYGTFNGTVKSLNRDGTGRWSTSVAHESIQSVTPGHDGTLYVTYSGALVALDGLGHEKWRQRLSTGVAPPPSIGDDGTLYVGGMGLTSFSPDGTRRWHLDLERALVLSPVIARDGTLFVGAVQSLGHRIGSVYAVTPDGAALWRYYVEPPSSLALASDGVLYVSAGNRIYALGECTKDACEDDGSALPANGPPGSVRNIASSKPKPRAPAPAKPEPSVRETHQGYTIYPECRPVTTAIVSSAGAEFSWLDEASPVKAAAERERFRAQALAAAGPIRSHASGFGVACVERGAFAIMVLPGEDVSAAAKRIGEWLVRSGLRGEVDLVVSPMPHLQ